MPRKKIPIVEYERTEICKECRFVNFEKLDGQGILSCRRFPPVFVLDLEDRETLVAHPEVQADHWCGEFKSKLSS
jgi:hypothetical protein